MYGRPHPTSLARRAHFLSSKLFRARSGGTQSPRPPVRPDLPEVDVAIVAESTYPYLRGGVSAVIHDIVVTNPDVEFGIIHITWDRDSPHTQLYVPPPNVRWVHHVYLSMQEHREDFLAVDVSELGGGSEWREQVAERLCDTIEHVFDGKIEPFWDLYDEAINPLTRTYNLWPILGTEEFMRTMQRRMKDVDIPFSDTFWLLREFFSLGCAVAGPVYPRARVYHAHTTGYAALIGALAARQHSTKFLLTEHNLYVRDTINEMLGRSMALPVRANDWLDIPDATVVQRAWMRWWIELGRVAYAGAELLTYLYPKALSEAADLGSPIERSVVVPNGMVISAFEEAYQAHLAAVHAGDSPHRVWRFCYIARIVPIKGLLDLIDSVHLLVSAGVTDLHVDILGPAAERPDYEQSCREKIAALGLSDFMTFRGSVTVRDHLGGYDALVLPSHNEGQPMVVLEAMAAGLPILGTDVGGMSQLVTETLYREGIAYGPCGSLAEPHDVEGMARQIRELMGDIALYRTWSINSRTRVETFFQLHDAMREYNVLYHELAGRADQLNLEEIDLAAIEARDSAQLTTVDRVADALAARSNSHASDVTEEGATGIELEVGEALDAPAALVNEAAYGDTLEWDWFHPHR
jgi:hypothetical protein